MAVKDPQTILARYQRGVSGGGTAYREGVTGAGGQWSTNAKSDAAEARYAAGVQKAAANKKRQKKLQKVSGADWETAAVNAGAPNYQASAAKAAANYSTVVADVVGAATAAQNAANSITGASLADRLNRSREANIAAHRYWAQKNGETPEA